VFPVRYELNIYILMKRYSVFKRLKLLHSNCVDGGKELRELEREEVIRLFRADRI
jgi:hypothetical protein